MDEIIKQAQDEYQQMADLWRKGLATEEELSEVSEYLDQVTGEEPDLPTYDDGKIDRVVTFRCCARCYGHLLKYPAPDRLWYAMCPECGEIWHGATVSKKYAESLAQKAQTEYYEVVFNPALKDILPERQERSEAELISQLGF